jgi:3-dehydroquinate synthase
MSERVAPIELELRHPAGVCPILVGEGLLEGDLPALAAAVGGRTAFLVSSLPVRALHGGAARSALGAASRIVELDVADGEAAKSVAEAERLWQAMLDAGGKRDSVVVSLGGGSVGDLAGFVAATFLRGVRFVQIPTTLLAQVDASVGGKTGIDLPGGKNTVGAFHQPLLVVADVSTLATLEPRQLRSGLFEVVKKGAVLDLPLLERVERDLDAALRAEPRALAPIVTGAIAAKARVVEEDPFEADRRRVLNFGHTLAHAIETCLGFRGLEHGEAVGHGMLFALELARERGLAAGEAARVEALIRRIGLPALPALTLDALCDALARDKKAREGGLAWVLPRRLGDAEIVPLEPSWVRARLERFLR